MQLEVIDSHDLLNCFYFNVTYLLLLFYENARQSFFPAKLGLLLSVKEY